MRHGLWTGLLVLGLGFAASADAATCTWGGSSGNWSVGANWSGCGGAAPGASDTAVINSGTPQVDVASTVAGLTINGGGLGGAQNLNVTTAFVWSGGALSGPDLSAELILDAGCTSTFGPSGSGRSISGSVMDYNAFNLPLEGEPKRELNMVTLGAYDYWAIEYGYTPVDTASELKPILDRQRSDRTLAFADDADNFGEGLDPLVNVFDLGDNPLAYAQRRLALSKELWARVQARQPKAGDDPERARRSVLAGFGQLRALPAIAAKYVGGMHTERDLPGTGKPAYRPVEPAMQRAALRFLTQELFSNDSFQFKPEFLQTLQPDYIEFMRQGPLNVPQAVPALQTQALERLLGPGTAGRLLQLPNYLPEAQRNSAISLHELYGTLQGAVWSELKTGKAIDGLRRSLQREHLKRLQGLLTRPAPTLPADAVSLARLHAVELQGQLRTALTKKAGMAAENRAHLEDALALVTEALRATLQRS